MEAVIRYKLLKEHNLHIVYVEGKVNFFDLLSYMNKLYKDKNYSPDYNVIDDLRNAQLEFSQEDIKKCIKIFEVKSESMTRTNLTKFAILTKTPEQVVKAFLYRKYAKNLSVVFEVFSTVFSAIDWLLLKDFSESDYNAIIEKLKGKSQHNKMHNHYTQH